MICTGRLAKKSNDLLGDGKLDAPKLKAIIGRLNFTDPVISRGRRGKA